MADRLVIVGGDAGGMAAISQVRKLDPKREIIAIERGHWTSYSACGIPYVVGGEVESVERLISRRPQEFRDRFGVDVRMRHEVMDIDLDRREADVREVDGSGRYRLGFDQLLVATGGRPMRPPLPGIDLPFLHGVQTLDDAVHLLDHAEEAGCHQVVVVGGGYIGLEIAEAFVQRGRQVTVIEQGPEVMPTLDPDMGALVGRAMRRHGIDVRTSTPVVGFEDGVVVGETERFPADLVLLGIGVEPESTLAEQAGLELGVKKAVRVDRRQHTSADGVWAAGDCCESNHLVSGRPVHIALGTIANKQSRVAGINIGGGDAEFPGVLGTAISKICATEVSRTGFTEREAALTGFEAVPVKVETTTRAGYYPGATQMTTKFVVERGTGRLLGAQIVGGPGAAKRIDVCAVALTARLTVSEMVNLDLAYAPPFSGVWDPVLVAAREALKAF
jgi:NADPH-dependent 2,4-dienoyl-CoA reductase/sulfur reductase-like enzyme